MAFEAQIPLLHEDLRDVGLHRLWQLHRPVPGEDRFQDIPWEGGNMKSEERNPYIPRPASIASVKNESLDSKTFKLRLINWTAQFRPGQFVQLLLPGIGEAPFCI